MFPSLTDACHRFQARTVRQDRLEGVAVDATECGGHHRRERLACSVHSVLLRKVHSVRVSLGLCQGLLSLLCLLVSQLVLRVRVQSRADFGETPDKASKLAVNGSRGDAPILLPCC